MQVSMAGSEGVIGLASFLGGESMPTRAVVLSAGYAFRLPAVALHREFEHNGPLPRLLLRYTLALMRQIGQISVCNRHHDLDQRLCRWLLSYLDRVPSSDLSLTQELIAHMLGVRREGVTEAVGRLREGGLICHNRGHITVLDRAGLEARACECYAVIRKAYDRLLRRDDRLANRDDRRRRGLYPPERQEDAGVAAT